MLVATVGIKADDKLTARVSDNTLKIALDNETSYCAFQMTVLLPKTVTATAVEAIAARLAQEGEDDVINSPKFIVAYSNLVNDNPASHNLVRIIAYNLANADINDVKGDILNVTLSAPIDDASQVSVSDIIFVKSTDLAEVELADVTAEDGVLMGDVNNDGKINIYDVAGVITIMNGGDTSQLNVAAADVNGDGNTNIYDVAAILQLMK